MNPIPIDIAVEDELSESVARRVLGHAAPKFAIGTTHRRGGFGYLRTRIRGWNEAARSRPIFLLTDLDDHACPSALIEDWLGEDLHANLVFRVAVREIESWLLADWSGITTFLKIPKKYLRSCSPPVPEQLRDPKAALIDLCSRSSDRDVKLRIVPSAQSTARVGREYNTCLCEFAGQSWNPEEARRRASSLDRAIRRLASFQPHWH